MLNVLHCSIISSLPSLYGHINYKSTQSRVFASKIIVCTCCINHKTACNSFTYTCNYTVCFCCCFSFYYAADAYAK